MGRRPAVDKFPQEIRELFYRLVREGRTIVEITEKLQELDTDVSQSAVGRSVKAAREQLKMFRAAQEVAGQWVADIHENPKGDVGMLCTQILQALTYQTMGNMADAQAAAGADAKPLKSMDLMLLAKTIKDLEATTKQSLERRERIKKLALEEAAKKAREVGSRLGISQDSLDVIEKELRLL